MGKIIEVVEQGQTEYCFIYNWALTAENIVLLYENPFLFFRPYEPSWFKRTWRKVRRIANTNIRITFRWRPK